MKKILLTKMRDERVDVATFRTCSYQLALILAAEASAQLERKIVPVETPLAKTQGEVFACEQVLVPILRSGLALLDPFLTIFSQAKVGFIGMRRDEKTAEPHQYYGKLPKICASDEVLLLDPMIATGGSACAAIKQLVGMGIAEHKIIFVAVIAAPEGIAHINAQYPAVRIVGPVIDDGLSDQKFITPGIGDFGDRYFRTLESETF